MGSSLARSAYKSPGTVFFFLNELSLGVNTEVIRRLGVFVPAYPLARDSGKSVRATSPFFCGGGGGSNFNVDGSEKVAA